MHCRVPAACAVSIALLWAPASAGPVQAPSAGQETSVPADIARSLTRAAPFTPTELTALQSGQVITRTEASPENLEASVVTAVKIGTTKDRAADYFHLLVSYVDGQVTVGRGVFSRPPKDADVAKLSLDAGDVTDLAACRLDLCDVRMAGATPSEIAEAVQSRSADTLEHATAWLPPGVDPVRGRLSESRTPGVSRTRRSGSAHRCAGRVAGNSCPLAVAADARALSWTVFERDTGDAACRRDRGNLLGQAALHRTEAGDRRDPHGDLAGSRPTGSRRDRAEADFREPLFLRIAGRDAGSTRSVRIEANDVRRVRESAERRSPPRHAGHEAVGTPGTRECRRGRVSAPRRRGTREAVSRTTAHINETAIRKIEPLHTCSGKHVRTGDTKTRNFLRRISLSWFRGFVASELHVSTAYTVRA